MNYYEELGVPASASAEEIRQAYKKLARLLHPDRQDDAHLRRLAELQMTRLNEILSVLSDPAARDRYDATLRAAVPALHPEPQNRPPSPAVPYRSAIRLRAGTMVWSGLLLVTACGFAFAFFYFDHGADVSVYRPSGEPVHVPESPPQAAVLPVQRPVAASANPPPAQVHENPSTEGQPLSPQPKPMSVVPSSPKPASSPNTENAPSRPEPPPQVAQVPAATEPSAPLSPPAPGVAPEPVASPKNTLVGTWLYVKPAAGGSSAAKTEYTAEYIEMVIRLGDNGRIIGNYRGQFHIPDRAISSEVLFQFEGIPGEGTNLFPWSASDGASGQVRMKMVSAGSMEVTWYTTRFGRAPKLASGAAVLYRE